MYQELVLPTQVTFICGNFELDFDEVLRFSTWMNQLGSYRRPPSMSQGVSAYGNEKMGLGGLVNVGSDRIRVKREGSISLFDERTRSTRPPRLKATDPRDVLYGILAIIDLPISPDYETPVDQLYTEFATHFIANGHLTAIVRHQRRRWNLRRTKESDLKLPSWVPDFSRGGLMYSNDMEVEYNADSFNKIKSLSLGSGPSVYGNRLLVSSIPCGEVETITSKIADIYPMVKRCLENDSESSERSYPTGISSLEAMARVVLSDMDPFHRGRRIDPNNREFLRVIVYSFLTMLCDSQRNDGPTPKHKLRYVTGGQDAMANLRTGDLRKNDREMLRTH